jgi:pilus assembly protein CpaF
MTIQYTARDSAMLAFLGGISQYLTDPGISEVMVNADGSAYIERDGELSLVGHDLVSPASLRNSVVRIARELGKDISEDSPLLDARLPDGSRVAASFPPAAVGGIQLCIRRFRPEPFTLSDLIAAGTLPGPLAAGLRGAFISGSNVLVSGQTGAGKTTVLGALLREIPGAKRLAIVEDTAEIPINRANIARFEAQPHLSITIRDLVRAAMRYRIERLVVGEVRGPEAHDLLQALNSGHYGSIATIHASSARRAVDKLTSYVLTAAFETPIDSIRQQIADAFSLVVQMRREGPSRVVSEVLRIDGYDRQTLSMQFTTVYQREVANG